MFRHRLRGASRAVVFLGLAAIATGCGSRSSDLQPGSYRAVLEVPVGDLPFGLDVAREESGIVLYLVNGEERVRVPDVSVEAGRLTARLPGDGNTLSASISGDELEGEVKLLRAGGNALVLPLAATRGQAWRFHEEPLTDNADFSGRWSVTLTDDDGRTTPGVAELEQAFGTVTGTVRTAIGDQRLLAGEARDDELALSRFDGAEAHLYRGKLNERGDLVGERWSGRTGDERFVAVRNPDAVLDTGTVGTGIEQPAR